MALGRRVRMYRADLFVHHAWAGVAKLHISKRVQTFKLKVLALSIS